MKAHRPSGAPTSSFIRAAAFVGCAMLLAQTRADPDLWGHVRFGGDIVAAGLVPRIDVYSFTSDRPWVNHEWLAEVIMYTAYRLGGAAGLVALKVALTGAMIAIARLHLRRFDVGILHRDMLSVLLVVGTLIGTLHVRPQLFSFVFYAALLYILGTADRGRFRALVAVPLLFGLWVNFNGGWIVGLGTAGVWLAFRCVQSGRTAAQRVSLLAVGLGSLLATGLSPYGVGMWWFILGTVGLGRAGITDWLPIYRLPVLLVVAWSVVMAGAAVLLVYGRRHFDYASLAILALLAYASFLVSRVGACLSIGVVMLLGPTIREAVTDGVAGPAPDNVRHTHVGPVLVALAILFVPLRLASLAPPHRIAIAGPWVPDEDSASFIAANQLRGRMALPFDWGEYAIWHFGPGLMVSMDGRRETVYSDRAQQANLEFVVGRSNALDYVDRTRADFAWLPNSSGAGPALEGRGWRRIFSGRASSIYARNPTTSYRQPPTTTAPRYFPGP